MALAPRGKAKAVVATKGKVAKAKAKVVAKAKGKGKPTKVAKAKAPAMKAPAVMKAAVPMKAPAVMKAAVPMKAPAVMKAAVPMKELKRKEGAALSKSGILQVLAEATELKRKECTLALETLTDLAMKEVKNTGVFLLPGICKLKTRVKPATQAGKREVFGKVMMVKAKPAKTLVKAFPVSAIKKCV